MSKIKSFGPGVFSRTGRNDCAVRALANVKGWSYIKAHEFMGEMGVRQANQGVFSHGLYHVYPAAGCTSITSYGSMAHINARLIDPEVMGLIEFTAIRTPIRLATTIRDICSEGRYVLSVPGHVFAVINGKIFDTIDNSGTTFVHEIFKFE